MVRKISGDKGLARHLLRGSVAEVDTCKSSCTGSKTGQNGTCLGRQECFVLLCASVDKNDQGIKNRWD